MFILIVAVQYIGREDSNYCPNIISKDTTIQSTPSAQTSVKWLCKDPLQPRTGEKRATHLSNMSSSTIGLKQLEGPIEISVPKKTWLPDGLFPGDKTQVSLPLCTAYSSKDMLSHSPSWPEESNTTSMFNREDGQAQTSFSDDLKLHKGGSILRISERQPSHISNSAQDSSLNKAQTDSQETPKKKRVWFSDTLGPDKLRKLQTFYLNDIEITQNSKRNGRIVGEIAFQLDRRILAHVFPGITRLYGFTVSNIPEKIKQVSLKSLNGSVDEKMYRAITQRYLDLTARLEKMGYHTEIHPVFSEFLINTYGILKQRPDQNSNPMHNNPAELRKIVIDIVPPKFLGDTLLLLNCLCELSKEDNKALFAW
ncbi:speriolin-like protein [Pogona vitticeps]